MRIVEIRRHTLREGGPHISDAGRRLAVATRATMAAAYVLVISSDKVRARETAEAMGFGVDAEDAAFTVMDSAELSPWTAEIEGVIAARECGRLAAACHVPGAAQHLREYARVYVEAVRGYLPRVPDGGRALIISHGWAIEQVAALFAADFTLEAIGGEFAPCEGFSLHFDQNGAVVALDVHRLHSAGPIS